MPAFDAENGVGLSKVPENKAELAEILRLPESKQIIKPKKPQSYLAQNVSYWLGQSEIYNSGVRPKDPFEPYFVAHRNIMFYDEIFNGCMFDKLSHMYNMRALGYKLKMVPDAFIVHLSHKALKHYHDWCSGYNTGPRYLMKKYSYEALAYRLKGFLRNEYYPPWLHNGTINTSLYERCKCENNAESQKRLEFAKSRVALLRSAFKLFTLLLVVLLAAFMVLTTKRNSEMKTDKY